MIIDSAQRKLKSRTDSAVVTTDFCFKTVDSRRAEPQSPVYYCSCCF